MTTWTSELRRNDASPAAARAMMRAHAGAMGDHAPDVALLVSELVTNAVRHGEAPITLALTLDGDVLRVDVRDGGSRERPVPRADGGDGGYGLRLVEILAHRWGVADDAAHVWFELDLDVPPMMPAAP